MNSVHHMPGIRLAGFSLFWTWLFLVAVSPSPVFGQLVTYGELPFEIPEVGSRIALLLCALALRRLFATKQGALILAATCMVAGPLTTLTLSLGSTPYHVLIASILSAITDVSMFLIWLCYFGYSKIGETALLLALSYAFGSMLCLASVGLGTHVMVAVAAAAPVASGSIFLFAIRSDWQRAQESLFAPTEPNANAEPMKAPASIVRLSVALALYGFVFALFSARTASSEFAFSSGPLLQSACNIAAAIVIVMVIRFSSKSRGLYGIYRVIPLLFTLGLAGFAALPSSAAFFAGAFVMLAYLLFEVLSLNDYCNLVKTNDSSLLSSMAVVRLCASVGIFLGWLADYFATHIAHGALPPAIVAALCLVLVVIASSLIFTDRFSNELRDIADSRALQETAESQPSRSEQIAAYAQLHALSKRETEVLEYLLAGRTTQYIASKLFIAESTARTHAHKIYAKTDTHDRMNLLDSFEKFRP